MLAQPVREIPSEGSFLYEPKWDGFRAIVFRDADGVFLQSRDGKPLDRYFPDLHETLKRVLPAHCVLDGEIVIATSRGLDFDALQLRLHPAASRVAKLAADSRASFVAFDVLAAEGRSVMEVPQAERRAMLERLLRGVSPPVHLTPMTREPEVARRWLREFEGAGLDGIVAKPVGSAYVPGKRVMIKVKHVRTADCVVAGFRWYKQREDAVGSLLLGLFDDADVLHHVGVASAFPMQARRNLALLLEPLRTGALEHHPWCDWQATAGHAGIRMPGGQSRWSAGKDPSWEPVRVERVCEVEYDHLQNDRFRHAARFLRWRVDKPAMSCRYDQIEVAAPFALAQVFGAGGEASSRRGVTTRVQSSSSTATGKEASASPRGSRAPSRSA